MVVPFGAGRGEASIRKVRDDYISKQLLKNRSLFTTQIIKQYGMNIAFRGTGEDRYDDFSLILRFFRLLQHSPGNCTATDTHRKPLLLHDANGGGNSILIGDSDHTINQVCSQCIGDETGAQTFNTVRAGPPSRENSATGRLDGNHLNRRLMCTQSLRHTSQGASSPHTDHDDIYLPTGLLPNLLGRFLSMRTRISLIIKLLGEPGIREGSAQ